MSNILNDEQVEIISKMAQETVQEVSKFANEVDANSLDSGSVTLSRKFTDMIRLVKPLGQLEEKGVVRVQEVEDMTDRAVFSVQVQQAFTWTEFDARGSEIPSLAAGSGSFQAYTAPNYVTIDPTTKSATLFIHDNIRLVNPVRMAEIMAQVMEEIQFAKEADAYTTLGTIGNYTASISSKLSSGYTALPVGSYVASSNTLTPADLVAAKKDLKTNGNRKIVPDVVVVATEQLSDLETHSDFSPGQSSNANFKKAVFDEAGTLVRFDGMEIVESIQMPQITTGHFASSSGHYAYVGKKGLIAARGEHTQRNKVETFRDPKNHGTEITMDVSYASDLLYPKAVRLIGCSDA